MTKQLEEKCFFFFDSRSERKKEKKGEGNGLTHTYQDHGCYDCNGRDKECRAYAGVDVKLPYYKRCKPFEIFKNIIAKDKFKDYGDGI